MIERERFEAWARQRWTHPEDFDQRIKAPSKYNNYEVQAAWEAWQERAAQPAPTEPEGWKLTPINPDHHMLTAGNRWANGLAYETYVAMITAAPEVKP